MTKNTIHQLKPCPLHEEPVQPVMQSDYVRSNPPFSRSPWWAEVECPKCGVYLTESECASEEEAIERVTRRWNTRYVPTCELEPARDGGYYCSHCHAWMSTYVWCDATTEHIARHCPNCGAKVVSA